MPFVPKFSKYFTLPTGHILPYESSGGPGKEAFTGKLFN
jgi:hypothetical protein